MSYINHIKQLYQLQASSGYTAAELQAAALRIGSTLPKSLQQYYQSLGKVRVVNFAHNRLLKPTNQLVFTPDDYLLIFTENQAVVQWGIKKEDLHQDNPAVWGNYGTADLADWQQETKTTTDFLMLMAVYNGVFGGLTYNANSLEPMPPKVVQFIADNWQEQEGISSHQQKIYTKEYKEVLSLSFDAQGQSTALFIGTQQEDHFNRLLDCLQVNWSYLSDEDSEIL